MVNCIIDIAKILPRFFSCHEITSSESLQKTIGEVLSNEDGR